MRPSRAGLALLLLASLARGEEPAAPRLRVEVAAVHTWSRALALAVEARGADGGLVARERLEARLELGLRATAAEPPAFALELAALELLHTREGAGEERWALPREAAPLAYRAICDAQGRLGELQGETLRAQLQARGCPPALAKLGQLYLFGLERGGRHADGPLLGAGPLLPGERDDPRRWSAGSDLLHGLAGLTGDLVGVHERWDWRTRAGDEPGAVLLAGSLGEVKVVRHFGGAPVDASEVASEAAAALDAAGLPLRCEARWAYTLASGQARVRVERSERLARLGE